MSPRLQRQLSEAFPLIMGAAKNQGSILCGDGWYGLLEFGFSEIQAFCDLCSEGSATLQVTMEQVREREGSLCFYHSVEGGDDFEREVIREIVSSMEISSLYFCEFTGVSPACLCRRGPRLRTLSYEVAQREGYELCSPDYANGCLEMRQDAPIPSAASCRAAAPPVTTGIRHHPPYPSSHSRPLRTRRCRTSRRAARQETQTASPAQ